MTTADVQLWSIDINPARYESDDFLTCLSNDELQRAGRLRLVEHRDRWIASRAMLRIILSSVIHRPPESLVFEYDEYSKPRLGGLDGGPPVHFNLTHSGDLALLAVTSVAPVGIDVELEKPFPDIEAVVERFFSAAERSAFSTLSGDEERLTAFYRCWTRKEAYLKALGCGISKPTTTFDVTFLEGADPKVVAINGDHKAAADWSLFDLPVVSGYTGSLAIRSRAAVRLVWHDLPPLRAPRNPG